VWRQWSSSWPINLDLQIRPARENIHLRNRCPGFTGASAPGVRGERAGTRSKIETRQSNAIAPLSGARRRHSSAPAALVIFP